MILVDSSVWIDHLRSSDDRLCKLLEAGAVLMHTMVIGELACGSLQHRDRRLRQWKDLPRLSSVSDDEAMRFIDHHHIMSRGLGFIDVHLLAAVAAATGTRLWTHDRRLAEITEELALAFPGCQ